MQSTALFQLHRLAFKLKIETDTMASATEYRVSLYGQAVAAAAETERMSTELELGRPPDSCGCMLGVKINFAGCR